MNQLAMFDISQSHSHNNEHILGQASGPCYQRRQMQRKIEMPTAISRAMRCGYGMVFVDARPEIPNHKFQQ
jgi:hypothetical protein